MAHANYEALLLDLDGTLLDIDMEQFIPAYTQQLARSFAPYTDTLSFAANLIESTRVMIENEDPAAINQDVFFDHFCRLLGQPLEKVYPLFDRFYQDEFNLLRSWTKPRPHVQSVVREAQKKGLKLALATNPVFPLTAISHRLNWSGLSTDDFDMITTVENMHFCKPRPQYYLEIAAEIKCPPELCLMAGNDVQEDLLASSVGMDTFLVEGFILNREDKPPRCTYQGSLEALAALIAE